MKVILIRIGFKQKKSESEMTLLILSKNKNISIGTYHDCFYNERQNCLEQEKY